MTDVIIRDHNGNQLARVEVGIALFKALEAKAEVVGTGNVVVTLYVYE